RALRRARSTAAAPGPAPRSWWTPRANSPSCCACWIPSGCDRAARRAHDAPPPDRGGPPGGRGDAGRARGGPPVGRLRRRAGDPLLRGRGLPAGGEAPPLLACPRRHLARRAPDGPARRLALVTEAAGGETALRLATRGDDDAHDDRFPRPRPCPLRRVAAR